MPVQAAEEERVGVQRWNLMFRVLTADAVIFIPWLVAMWLLR